MLSQNSQLCFIEIAALSQHNFFRSDDLIVLTVEVDIGEFTGWFELEPERTSSLSHSPSPSTEEPLKTQAPFILEANELNYSIGMAILLIILVLIHEVGSITIAVTPDVRNTTHIIVDVHSNDVSVFLANTDRRLLTENNFGRLFDMLVDGL
jgi:hypothetical protein